MSEVPAGAVVVVATEETAQGWAIALEARGIRARACPVSRVVAPHPPDAARSALDASDDALVLATSANAVRFLPSSAGAGRRAAAVGAATARALRAAGFTVAVEGTAGAEDLARRLASGPPARALWLRGDRARPEGAEVLRAAGWRVDEVVAYRTVPHEGFSACVTAAPAAAWVLGSPAGVDALAAALAAAGRSAWLRVPLVAVGATTCAALVAQGLPGGVAAAVPSAEAVVSAVVAALAGRVA